MRRKDPQMIKRARLRARLTQRQLAYLVGVSQTTVYLLEREGSKGMQTCSDALAEQIAMRLNVDLEDLFEARTDFPVAASATGNVAASLDARNVRGRAVA